MFHDLKNAYQEMLNKASRIVDNDGIHISFPEHLFSKFEQEYNLCFVEPEDDVTFRSWQDNDNEEDDE
jgi:hypothetical protein